MRLQLLGTGGYHPSPARHTLCLHLPEAGLIFDAGTAAYRLRGRLQQETLDLFLSHSHLDHVVGLTYFLDILYQHPLRTFRIHGRPEDLEVIREHLFHPGLFGAPVAGELCPLEETFSLADGGTLRHFPLQHPGGSVGYRIDWPETSLAYVTDTTASFNADYLEHIRGVSLLVHECYFSDAQAEHAVKTGHSSLSQVAHLAATAEVGRVLLVHINPLADEFGYPDLAAAQAIFPKMEFAYDLQEVHF
ncbi:MBL fold metallo-hydrolase [Planctomycetales bacterium 10988]|nr:MBL fold metallo-hydrolase [Planctomycetales bacterium 10988]